MNDTKITIQIDDSGRVVIPKPVRDQLNLKSCDKLIIKVIDKHIEIKKEGE